MTDTNNNLSYTLEDAESRFIRLRTDVAVQIDKLREHFEMTQREFAAKLGKNETYVSRLVSGTENLTLKTIAQVEHVFGESVITIPWVQAQESEIEIEEPQTMTMGISEMSN